MARPAVSRKWDATALTRYHYRIDVVADEDIQDFNELFEPESISWQLLQSRNGYIHTVHLAKPNFDLVRFFHSLEGAPLHTVTIGQITGGSRLTEVLQALSLFPTLRHLSIVMNLDERPLEPYLFWKYVCACLAMETLTISAIKWKMFPFPLVAARRLAEHRRLNHLTLKNVLLSEGGCMSLGRLLQQSTTLIGLAVVNSTLQGARWVLEGLQNNPDTILGKLDLHDTPLNVPGQAMLLQRLTDHPTLDTVIVDFTNLHALELVLETNKRLCSYSRSPMDCRSVDGPVSLTFYPGLRGKLGRNTRMRELMPWHTNRHKHNMHLHRIIYTVLLCFGRCPRFGLNELHLIILQLMFYDTQFKEAGRREWLTNTN